MGKTVLGIDIGNYNVKFVEAINNKGKMEMLNYDIARMPENAINDGKITDIEKVYVTIGNLLRKNHIKENKAVAIVSSSALITREVNIPKMKDSELSKYIQIDSQQHFPVDLAEYIFDYRVVGEVKGKEGPEYTVLLVAIPQMIINDYINVFDKLNLELLAIDIVPNVMSKYVQNHFILNNDKNNTVALIDMGAKNTIVTILENGSIKFNRMIPHGSSDITRIICDTYNLSFPEGEEYKLKNAEIVLDTHVAQGLSVNISETIKPVLDGLVSSINKFFEFYQSRNNSGEISSIVLLGGGANLNGIDGYYRSIFNIPVRRINISDGIIDKSKKPSIQKDLGFILNSLAATYREID